MSTIKIHNKDPQISYIKAVYLTATETGCLDVSTGLTM
jgi:hypothetical protein